MCIVHFNHNTVPELPVEFNSIIQAIPERLNGLFLALINNTDLVFAIGTREGKVMTILIILHIYISIYRYHTMLRIGQKSLVMYAHH